MGGRPRVLEAAALVDGDVDEHAARLHRGDLLVGDELRRLRAGHEHGADHHVGVADRLLQFERVRGDRAAVPLVDRVRDAQLGDVAVEQQHLGLHPERDGGRVAAGHAGADDHDLRRVHARDATHQDPAAAFARHQRVRGHDGSEPPGDLAHRGQQRQRVVRQLHGLVGDAGDPALEQRVGALRVGGQVQVGEQHLPVAHPVVLLRTRFLDLEHQVADGPGLVGGRQDARAGGDELRIGDAGADAGVVLDEHLVPVPGEFVHARGGDRHPELVVLDLARHGDLHAGESSRGTSSGPGSDGRPPGDRFAPEPSQPSVRCSARLARCPINPWQPNTSAGSRRLPRQRARTSAR